MELIKINAGMADALAPLVAEFRVTLESYRGVASKPDIEAGREELLGFLGDGFPVFAAVEGDVPVGYAVFRIDEPCLWVEHLFVRPQFRRRGAASMLFDKAEEIAKAMGEDTVFNFVHPNNDGVIAFLRSKGYTVLNMIEIRKPYRNERPGTKISVGGNEFDY